MENFHPELAVSVKSVLENPELAVCRAVSSVSVWKVHFLREYQFSIGKILLFQEEEGGGKGLYEVNGVKYEVATTN